MSSQQTLRQVYIASPTRHFPAGGFVTHEDRGVAGVEESAQMPAWDHRGCERVPGGVLLLRSSARQC